MFQRNKTARPGKSAAHLSFIGPEVVITGNLATEAQLHIDGRVEGDVRCSFLSQGKEGTIAGNIDAEEVRLAGLVDGAVKARTLLLEPTARVTGDVTYETLSIASGAQIDGHVARQEQVAQSAGSKPSLVPPAASLFTEQEKPRLAAG